MKKDQELVGLHLSHGHCRGDEPSKRHWERYPHPPPPHRKRKRVFAELEWLLCSSRHWHRSPPLGAFPQTDLHLKECSAISHGYVSGCANSILVWTPAAKVSPLPTLWSEMETKWWQWVTITTIYALNRTFLSKSSICLEWSFIKEYSLVRNHQMAWQSEVSINDYGEEDWKGRRHDSSPGFIRFPFLGRRLVVDFRFVQRGLQSFDLRFLPPEWLQAVSR